MSKYENVNIDKLRKGVFLANRGGGIRSCVSIGVLKALEEARIPVLGVSGESLSSLFAALVATGYSSEEILELFLRYNEIITKSGKIFGGKGSVVIEEIINELTYNLKMKDLGMPCYINAATGSCLNPGLYIFSKTATPNRTLGEACRASASIPVIFGAWEDGENRFLDGGLKLNPYIPGTQLPVILASFHNYIDLFKLIPALRKTIIPANNRADIIIDAPVGNISIVGSNKQMIKAYNAGYEEARKALKL